MSRRDGDPRASSKAQPGDRVVHCAAGSHFPRRRRTHVCLSHVSFARTIGAFFVVLTRRVAPTAVLFARVGVNANVAAARVVRVTCVGVHVDTAERVVAHPLTAVGVLGTFRVIRRKQATTLLATAHVVGTSDIVVALGIILGKHTALGLIATVVRAIDHVVTKIVEYRRNLAILLRVTDIEGAIKRVVALSIVGCELTTSVGVAGVVGAFDPIVATIIIRCERTTRGGVAGVVGAFDHVVALVVSGNVLAILGLGTSIGGAWDLVVAF